MWKIKDMKLQKALRVVVCESGKEIVGYERIYSKYQGTSMIGMVVCYEQSGARVYVLQRDIGGVLWTSDSVGSIQGDKFVGLRDKVLVSHSEYSSGMYFGSGKGIEVDKCVGSYVRLNKGVNIISISVDTVQQESGIGRTYMVLGLRSSSG